MTTDTSNAPLAYTDPCTQFSGRFVTGYGEKYTHRKDNNTNRYAGQNYETVSLQDIINRMSNPQCVVKEEGQWIIPSSYSEFDARSAKAQEKHGRYWALVCDIDKSNPSIGKVIETTKAIFGDVFFLVWATSKCHPQDQRWRVLIPCKLPMDYVAFKSCQITWYTAMYQNGIKCDHKLLDAQQYNYLPNRGEFYHHQIVEGELFDQNNWQHLPKARAYGEIMLAERRKKEERRPRFKDDYDVFANVREAFDLHDVLDKAGYIQNPSNPDQFRSPTSQSNGYAVQTYDDGGWNSLHGSDRDAGFVSGDVSDIFRRFFGWSQEDVIGVGLGLRAGFNPAGIPYKQIPALARVPLFSGRIKLPDGTYLHVGRKKEPPACTEGSNNNYHGKA